MTGRPLSSWQEGNLSPAVDGEAIPLVIAPRSREELHGRIARRFDDMLSEGFLEEVEALYRRGDLTPDLPAIRAVGYRQMWRYVAGETNLETAREAGIAATRQLAKRQLTGLRRWPDALWLLTGPDLQLSEVKTASEGRLLALARTIDTTLIKGEQVFSRPSHSFSRQIGEILRNLVANGNN
jgi:tRNA dimethylallyltransferase